MTKKEIKQMAEKMEVDEEWAMEARIRHLMHLIGKETSYQGSLKESLSAGQNDMTTSFLNQSISTSNKIAEKHYKEIDRLKALPSNDPNQINDDDIEAARNYPVDQIIEFRNGRCNAFCHDGKSENSMSHFKKGNKAHCFVCDKSFSALDVLMERDAMGFIDAVKELR